MKKLGMGLVGPGFVAPQHIDAVRRLGDVDVIGIAGSSAESARRKAGILKVERSYGNYADLIADPDIDVVHITTPNYLHFPIATAALRAGKHVVCDKPLAMTTDECAALCQEAARAGVGQVVTFNYRGNPMVQHAREMVARGVLGEVIYVHGCYLQDWMASADVYSWRSDPSKGGPSSALGDIGSHWCDLAEHISGKRITHVAADLSTTIRQRFPSGGTQEAFADRTFGERQSVSVDSEDLGSVMLRFEGGARGMFCVGQVISGHKNDLQIEVSGRNESLRWKQETQNELWAGRHDEPNRILLKDPTQMEEASRRFTRLPGGHQEGWPDAFFNLIRDAYAWIESGARTEDRPEIVPTFEDGYRSACLIEAMLESNAADSAWRRVHGVPVMNNALAV